MSRCSSCLDEEGRLTCLAALLGPTHSKYLICISFGGFAILFEGDRVGVGGVGGFGEGGGGMCVCVWRGGGGGGGGVGDV